MCDGIIRRADGTVERTPMIWNPELQCWSGLEGVRLSTGDVLSSPPAPTETVREDRV
jgi:hypothetical protein